MTNMLQSLRPPKEKRDPLSAPVIGLHVHGKSFTTHMWKGIHRNNEEINRPKNRQLWNTCLVKENMEYFLGKLSFLHQLSDTIVVLYEN